MEGLNRLLQNNKNQRRQAKLEDATTRLSQSIKDLESCEVRLGDSDFEWNIDTAMGLLINYPSSASRAKNKGFSQASVETIEAYGDRLPWIPVDDWTEELVEDSCQSGVFEEQY